MSGEGNLLKILVLGDTATGKTSFIKRYVHNTHSKDHKATVGVDFVLKQLQVNKKSVRKAIRERIVPVPFTMSILEEYFFGIVDEEHSTQTRTTGKASDVGYRGSG